jgi:hypothetical protein
MELLRHPAFGVGLLLLVLGVGNWSVAHGKLAEYTDSLSIQDTPRVGSIDEFKELDARTNAELLRPFRRGVGAYAMANVKPDFYKVVQTGGQLFSFIGVGFVLFASASVWRRSRAVAVPSPH